MRNLYHRIVAALILLAYRDKSVADEKSFDYYCKHVK